MGGGNNSKNVRIFSLRAYLIVSILEQKLWQEEMIPLFIVILTTPYLAYRLAPLVMFAKTLAFFKLKCWPSYWGLISKE